jgi:hypothetical protein
MSVDNVQDEFERTLGQESDGRRSTLHISYLGLAGC